MSLIRRVMWCCAVLRFSMIQTPLIVPGAAPELVASVRTLPIASDAPKYSVLESSFHQCVACLPRVRSMPRFVYFFWGPQKTRPEERTNRAHGVFVAAWTGCSARAYRRGEAIQFDGRRAAPRTDRTIREDEPNRDPQRLILADRSIRPWARLSPGHPSN